MEESDERLQLDIWGGAIPIEISLPDEEVGTLLVPDPVVILASRMGYLPNIARHVVENFQGLAVEFSSEAWFEAGGIHLKSHYPLGVLYDVVGKAQRGRGSDPWKILVHFVAPAASSEIPPLELTGAAICERLYFHSLKQALQLLYGSIRNFNELSLEKQSTLWMSPTKKQWEQFYVVREALIPSAVQMKSLPLRVLDARKRLSQPLPITRQRSAQAMNGDKPVSLREILLDRLTVLTREDLPHVDVVVQGVTCDLDAEAYELWKLLCHADLFLYIVIRDRETSIES